MRDHIDTLLGGIERPFTRFPDTLGLGSTGARLWADYLYTSPGFSGRFGYINAAAFNQLYDLNFHINGQRLDLAFQNHRWYPSRLISEYHAPSSSCTETKFITWDDTAVTVLEIQTAAEASVKIETDRNLFEGTAHAGAKVWERIWTRIIPPEGPEYTGCRREARPVGYKAELNLRPDPQQHHDDAGNKKPAPNGHFQLIIAAALGGSPEEAEEKARAWAGAEDPAEQHRAEYQTWFDQAPAFNCSDPWLEKMWNYRLFLIRYNLADPRSGYLQEACFYDGRHGIVTEGAPAGKEELIYDFSAYSTCNATHSLHDLTWLSGGEFFRRSLANFWPTQTLDVSNEHETASGRSVIYSPPGMLVSVIHADRLAGAFHPHYIPRIVSDYHRLYGDKAWIKEILPHLADDARAWIKYYTDGSDLLPICPTHGNTAMEYQPSFFYFNGYPDLSPGYRHSLQAETALKRTDFTAFLHANLTSISDLYRSAGNPEEAESFGRLAETLAADIRRNMWHQQDSFFYDLHFKNKTPARDKMISGFWPLFLSGHAGIPELTAVFDWLDRTEFSTTYPAPSAGRDCPVYAPDNTWKGQRVHMCMWNGPLWPYSESFLIQAMIQGARTLPYNDDRGRRLRKRIPEIMNAFTRLMFRGGCLDTPCVVEHYNPETGEPLSTEDDYFHSHYLDLIVKTLGGLNLCSPGTFHFEPMDFGVDNFSLEDIPCRDGMLAVSFDEQKYTVRLNGRIIHSQNNRVPKRINLGPADASA